MRSILIFLEPRTSERLGRFALIDDGVMEPVAG
jgi:hypothetical protein